MRRFMIGLSLALAGCQSTDADLKPLSQPTFNEAAPPAISDQAPLAATTASSIRFATYNTSLYSEEAGGLIKRLQSDDISAKKIAAVIQHQRPDVVLLNEFDFDANGTAADLFQKNYLALSQDQQAPIEYRYRYFAPVNTGVQSGMDLDNNGVVGGEGRSRGNDAFGYGLHPGQYGMLVLSKFPIDEKNARSFQNLLWKDLPGALIPTDPKTQKAWYGAEVWPLLRLSSKSHWDVPITTPKGVVHFLVSHPTPPVFDGPEDRNGTRNHDEIKLWAEYLTNKNTQWLCDDKGICGGLDADARFVIAGDLNADPIDGDRIAGAINQLLQHPRVSKHGAPASEGALQASKTVGEGNLNHRGNAANDTGDFGPKVGNMRLDYVLPSANMTVKQNGVFWVTPSSAQHAWMDASDHRMVWVDVVF
jgi:endonuclease/exonuclease/phosphatase family metal-dependent hydrolase